MTTDEQKKMIDVLQVKLGLNYDEATTVMIAIQSRQSKHMDSAIQSILSNWKP